jgi:hypothetical protein
MLLLNYLDSKIFKEALKIYYQTSPLKVKVIVIVIVVIEN